MTNGGPGCQSKPDPPSVPRRCPCPPWTGSLKARARACVRSGAPAPVLRQREPPKLSGEQRALGCRDDHAIGTTRPEVAVIRPAVTRHVSDADLEVGKLARKLSNVVGDDRPVKLASARERDDRAVSQSSAPPGACERPTYRQTLACNTCPVWAS